MAQEWVVHMRTRLKTKYHGTYVSCSGDNLRKR